MDQNQIDNLIEYFWSQYKTESSDVNNVLNELLHDLKQHMQYLFMDSLDSWLPPAHKKILHVLKQHDASLTSLSKSTGYSIDGIRGRISELRHKTGFRIEHTHGIYHLYSPPRAFPPQKKKQPIKHTKKRSKETEWSFDEENFLRDHFFTLGTDKIVKNNLLPNRTKKQILVKARFMGMIL